MTVEQRMKLNDAARELIGSGADATLVTLNSDDSPQVTLVWVALQSTPDGEELVTAHLAEHQKVRNVRRDGLDAHKTDEKTHEISEDEHTRLGSEVQKMTADTNKDIDAAAHPKEQEILGK